MTKTEFENLFNEINTKAYESSIASITDSLTKSRSEKDQISIEELIILFHIENMKFTSDLIKSVFLQALSFDQ